MSDCVYTAFIDHAKYLGVEVSPYSLKTFHRKKSYAQAINEFTWGGIVPSLIEYLCEWYPLHIAHIEHTVWTPEFYAADAPSFEAGRMTLLSDWGEHVKAITLQPAIYGLLSSNHAVFSTSVPIGEWVILAIQLERIPSLRPAELY